MKSANKLKHGNIASIVLCLVVLCSIFLNPQSVVSENNLNTSLVETVSLPGFQQIAENEKMKLFANTENGEISVYVKDTGYIWRSNPVDHEQDSIAKGQYKNALASQIILYYSQGFSEISVNSKAGSVDKGGLKFEKIDKGIKFTFTFPDIEYSIPVQYQLEKDYLKAQVLTEEITPELVTRTEERGQGETAYTLEIDYNITKIDFLPYFGAAGLNEQGYMMIPDGSGAIIYFNNGKTIYDSYYAPVYGKYRDIPSLSVYSDDSVRLPVFGMKRDNDAFIAVIHQNESTAFINASVSGKYTGYNSVFPSFQYKVIEANVGETYTQPYAPVLAPNGNYEVRYYFLTGDAADYSGMAQKYRQYLVDEKGLQKAQNINQSSLYIDLYGGVVKEKSILGIPREVFEPLTTFTQLKELSNDLKSKGIDSIVFRYMEWMRGKDRGKVPVKAMPDKKLGSQKAFMDFISYAVNNNIGFYPNVNLIHFSRNGGGFNRLFDAVKAPGQSPAFQYEKDNPHIALGRRWYLLNPQGVQKAAGKYINSFNKYGNNAISIDSLGNTVYSDNRKNGTMRGDITDIWTDVLASIKKNSYSIMLEDANAYAFPYTDRIVNAPSPERRIEIADEAIPFYQMALHGYIPYTTSPINLSSDPELAFLKAIETGSDIHYTFVMNDTSILKDTYLDYLYSCNPDFWMDTAVEQYKNAANIYTQLKEKPIVKHSKLQEGVYETVYEGNIHIVVNYNSNDVNVDGNIIKAKGFARIER